MFVGGRSGVLIIAVIVSVSPGSSANKCEETGNIFCDYGQNQCCCSTNSYPASFCCECTSTQTTRAILWGILGCVLGLAVAVAVGIGLCCCFCSHCPCYKRRMRRRAGLYPFGFINMDNAAMTYPGPPPPYSHSINSTGDGSLPTQCQNDLPPPYFNETLSDQLCPPGAQGVDRSQLHGLQVQYEPFVNSVTPPYSSVGDVNTTSPAEHNVYNLDDEDLLIP